MSTVGLTELAAQKSTGWSLPAVIWSIPEVRSSEMMKLIYDTIMVSSTIFFLPQNAARSHPNFFMGIPGGFILSFI